MTKPGTPASPQPPAAPDSTRKDAPAKTEAQGKKKADTLKDGSVVRVTLTGARPMFCHTQNQYLSPGQEHKLEVDKWIRANLERGNIAIVS